MNEMAATLIVLQSVYITYGGLLTCNPPTYTSPIEDISTFRRRKRQKYPWLEINTLIQQNTSLHEVKLMRRKASLQRRLDKLNMPTDYDNDSKITKICTTDWRYLTLFHFIEDPKEGECWIVRNWWRYIILWVQCEKYCRGVPHKHPFHVYTCVPGTVENFSFWIYCSGTKQLLKRTIVFPKCCVCRKYTCYHIPMVLPIPN